jgi:hypothetical protein
MKCNRPIVTNGSVDYTTNGMNSSTWLRQLCPQTNHVDRDHVYVLISRMSSILAVKLEKALRTNRIRLFESSTVINVDDLVFYPVSLNNDKQQKRRRPMITSDTGYYQLPDAVGIINLQYSEYYYPLPYAFPGNIQVNDQEKIHRCLLLLIVCRSSA